MSRLLLVIFFIVLIFSPSINAEQNALEKKKQMNRPVAEQNRTAVIEPEHMISPILTVHQKPSPLDEFFITPSVHNSTFRQVSQVPTELDQNNTSSAISTDYVKKASFQRLHSVHGYNEIVEKKLNFLTGSFRSTVAQWLGLSSRYLPLMVDIIEEKGLPVDLVFLPLIESGFKTSAYSSAHAAGQWQFIAPTGQRYGLKINEWVDERRDPEKATRAAAHYLSDIYEMFGSWNLALAGYNCGENRIAQAVSQSGSRSFWKIRNLLPQETQNYVPIYIAATMIAKDPSRYGFNDVKYQKPLEFDLVMLETPMELKTVAHLSGTSVETLRSLNPELKTNKTPPNVSYYLMRIPEGKRKTFFNNLNRLVDRNDQRKQVARK